MQRIVFATLAVHFVDMRKGPLILSYPPWLCFVFPSGTHLVFQWFRLLLFYITNWNLFICLFIWAHQSLKLLIYAIITIESTHYFKWITVKLRCFLFWAKITLIFPIQKRRQPIQELHHSVNRLWFNMINNANIINYLLKIEK
jgi:hypothetical protein